MSQPAAPARASLADLEALPADQTGELIAGVLHVFPRLRPHHQNAGSVLGADLNGPFQRGRGGPGGWWILVEPGIRLASLDVEEVVPDLTGWRRERLPALPDRAVEIAPDWICEVLSPSTRHHDQRIKRPLYATAGVEWLWFVDVDARTLIASHLEGGRWVELGVWADDEVARIEPFAAVELHLGDLWKVS